MFPDGLLDSALLRTLLYGGALIAFLFAVCFSLEALAAGNLRRYRSRNFATDLAYMVVYLGGIYQVLIYVPIFSVIAMLVPPTWHVRALQELPPLAGFLVYWVVADFIAYWLHRWMHHSPLLWRVHRVHHAQTCLTFATSWRNHLLEQLFFNIMMYVPLMLLGMPKWYWLPVMLLQYLFEAIQHADLNWRFGRLYPVVVSPVFHAIHHSPERSRHDSNYGKILSLWDRLFGTMSRGERPERYGLIGQPMPVSFWGTLLAPFRSPPAPAAAPVGEAARQGASVQ